MKIYNEKKIKREGDWKYNMKKKRMEYKMGKGEKELKEQREVGNIK